jgi:hypothetical protein
VLEDLLNQVDSADTELKRWNNVSNFNIF